MGIIIPGIILPPLSVSQWMQQQIWLETKKKTFYYPCWKGPFSKTRIFIRGRKFKSILQTMIVLRTIEEKEAVMTASPQAENESRGSIVASGQRISGWIHIAYNERNEGNVEQKTVGDICVCGRALWNLPTRSAVTEFHDWDLREEALTVGCAWIELFDCRGAGSLGFTQTTDLPSNLQYIFTEIAFYLTHIVWCLLGKEKTHTIHSWS